MDCSDRCPGFSPLLLSLQHNVVFFHTIDSCSWHTTHTEVARVNQPPWLHQLVILSIGCAGWFAYFSLTSLPYITNILPQSIFFGCWPLTIFFHCQFFPNPDLHTTQPPNYSTNINFSLVYELTMNPLFILAKLLSSLG